MAGITGCIWPPTTCLNVYTDACPTTGGGFCPGDLMYRRWLFVLSLPSSHHINTNELVAGVMSALWWRHLWAYCYFLARCSHHAQVSAYQLCTIMNYPAYFEPTFYFPSDLGVSHMIILNCYIIYGKLWDWQDVELFQASVYYSNNQSYTSG